MLSLGSVSDSGMTVIEYSEPPSIISLLCPALYISLKKGFRGLPKIALKALQIVYQSLMFVYLLGKNSLLTST